MRKCLVVLLSGLHANHRQAVIADMLTNSGLPSVTGNPWTVDAVKGVLKRLRQRKGPFYVAMLQACFDGQMTPQQCRPLLQTL